MVETVTVDGFPLPDARRRLRAARAGPAGGPERREARAAQGRAPRRGRRADRARRRPRGPARLRAARRARPRGAARGCSAATSPVLAAGAAAAGPAGRQPAGPQAAALRHHDALARARRRERDLPLWEVAVQYEMDASGLAARLGRRPHARARRWSCAGRPAPCTRRTSPSSTPRSSRTSPAAG